MNSPLRKLVWMVVAIAAMVLLAPLAASAHEDHPGRQVATHTAAHHQQASTHVVDSAAARSDQQTTAQPGNFDRDHDLCKSGCCFGVGCCGGTIVSGIPAIHPPAGLPLLIPHTARRLVSAPLNSLLEPPNALA